VHVFHAGTTRDAEGTLRTAGGRVLAVTAVAPTLAEAQRRSRETAAAVEFDGRQYRGDIAWREVRRHAGAA
jgi:phosphoribosylamine---glycine ligase